MLNSAVCLAMLSSFRRRSATSYPGGDKSIVPIDRVRSSKYTSLSSEFQQCTENPVKLKTGERKTELL